MEVKCSNTEANLINSETERLASIRAMEIERINSIKAVLVKIDGLSAVEEKIRIVLEGLGGGKSIAELCRREGIAESLYYSWSKDFLEAGKKRLAEGSGPGTTCNEVNMLRAEARELKETLAEQMLENRLLKKSIISEGRDNE